MVEAVDRVLNLVVVFVAGVLSAKGGELLDGVSKSAVLLCCPGKMLPHQLPDQGSCLPDVTGMSLRDKLERRSTGAAEERGQRIKVSPHGLAAALSKQSGSP